MGKGHGLLKTGMKRALDPSIIGNTALDYHACCQIVPDLIAGDKPRGDADGRDPVTFRDLPSTEAWSRPNRCCAT